MTALTDTLAVVFLRKWDLPLGTCRADETDDMHGEVAA